MESESRVRFRLWTRFGHEGVQIVLASETIRKENPVQDGVFLGAPCWIRTSDRPLRRRTMVHFNSSRLSRLCAESYLQHGVFRYGWLGLHPSSSLATLSFPVSVGHALGTAADSLEAHRHMIEPDVGWSRWHGCALAAMTVASKSAHLLSIAVTCSLRDLAHGVAQQMTPALALAPEQWLSEPCSAGRFTGVHSESFFGKIGRRKRKPHGHPPYLKYR